MPQRESGTTRASMSHTIAFLNAPRIFAARCFAGLTMCDSIRKRSKACFIPFFDIDVDLFMRTYIVPQFPLRLTCVPTPRLARGIHAEGSRAPRARLRQAGISWKLGQNLAHLPTGQKRRFRSCT